MAPQDKQISAEVVVVGGGPAGLTAAIALASAGVDTVLVEKRPEKPDHRTTALFAGSVTALETLGVWTRCVPHAAPMRVMRIIDDTGRLLRAPEVSFSADEIGLDVFGYNIENVHLVAALDARADEMPALRRIEERAQSVDVDDAKVKVTLADDSVVTAPLAVGADGRRSPCRTAAGIETEGWRYKQAALVLNLAHTRPHHDTSTEFHTETGPFTLVPLPGLRSSLVCVLDPATADELFSLDDDALSREIERRAHSLLGRMTVEPGRGLFPLGVETARTFAANRVALVGEAAHVFPPIGAQGLNLGLRDAATIAEIVAAERRAGRDFGVDAALARYDRARRADVTTRTMATDLLNRSLLTDFLPLHGARGFGLFLLDRIGPLRRAVMREGVTPMAAAPRLMRGEMV